MPAKVLSALLCVFVILSPARLRAQEGGQALRGALEQAYEQWRSAMTRRDARAWALSVSTFRQVVMRNQIVSQRKPFPDSVFALPVDPPPIAGLRLLEVQAVGPTAHLLYFGKVNMGGNPAEIPDNILMLKFFQEHGVWKFDSSRILKLMEQPDLRAQLQAGGVPKFLDYPEFTPPGKLPPTPPLCGIPTHVTAGTVQSHGYEATITINGFDYPTLSDQSEKLLVIGGLNDGPNTVTLVVKPNPVPQGAERLLQLDLFIAPKQPGQPGTRVFHYQSRDPDLTGTIKLPCVITPEVVSKGR